MSPAKLTLPRPIELGLPCALIVAALIALEPVTRGKIPQFLIFLGGASYAIYLFHPLTAPAGAAILARLGILTAPYPWRFAGASALP